jgi:hypothetical protein
VFRQELLSLEPIGSSLLFVNSAFLHYVRKDSHAKSVQDALYRLNKPMYEAAFILFYFLPISVHSYAHDPEEIHRLVKGLQIDITDEHVATLYDPNFQATVMESVLQAKALLAMASQIIRDQVLPTLPDVESELSKYVATYKLRQEALKRRSRSCLPIGIQNVLHGAMYPIPWNLADVELLIDTFNIGARGLHRLLVLIDSMEQHFRQLSELQHVNIRTLGYSTPEDFLRLYSDRVACCALILRMDSSWHHILRVFSFGKTLAEN